MIFKELAVGDWFIDNSGTFLTECIFMKTTEESAICLNWNSANRTAFDEDTEVNFCTSFSATALDTDPSGIGLFCRTPYEPVEESWELVHYFSEIPMFALYRGKGQTYYKKVSDTSSVVFWTPKASTMGKYFERDEKDISTHYGTYYLCKGGMFNYPEMDLKFPFNEKTFRIDF